MASLTGQSIASTYPLLAASVEATGVAGIVTCPVNTPPPVIDIPVFVVANFLEPL